jgi:hypothetical protein
MNKLKVLFVHAVLLITALIFFNPLIFQGCNEYTDPVSALSGGEEVTFDGKEITITGVGLGYAPDYSGTNRLMKGNSEDDIPLYKDGDDVYIVLTNQQGAAIYVQEVGTWPGNNGFYTCPSFKVTWGDYRAFMIIGGETQIYPMYIEVNSSGFVQLTQAVHGKSPKGNEYDYYVFSLVSKCSGECTSIKQTYDNLNSLRRIAPFISNQDELTKNLHNTWSTDFPDVNPPYPEMDFYWQGANCCDEDVQYVSNLSETGEEYIGGEGTRYVDMNETTWNGLCFHYRGIIVKNTEKDNSYTLTAFRTREPQNPPLGVRVLVDKFLPGLPQYNKSLIHLFDQAWGINGTFYYVFQFGFDQNGLLQNDDNRVEMITLHGSN